MNRRNFLSATSAIGAGLAARELRLVAQIRRHAIFPGRTTDLMTYRAQVAGRDHFNPLLRVRALRNELGLELGRTEIPLILQDKQVDVRNRIRYSMGEDDWIGNRMLVNAERSGSSTATTTTTTCAP